VTTVGPPEISPEEASRSGSGQMRDEAFPMLAATWLAQGYFRVSVSVKASIATWYISKARAAPA
jgi:hypothetical protein